MAFGQLWSLLPALACQYFGNAQHPITCNVCLPCGKNFWSPGNASPKARPSGPRVRRPDISPSGAFGQVPNACSQIDRGAQSKRNDTRIFSPLAVARLWVTIGRYWYAFKRFNGGLSRSILLIRTNRYI